MYITSTTRTKTTTPNTTGNTIVRSFSTEPSATDAGDVMGVVTMGGVDAANTHQYSTN